MAKKLTSIAGLWLSIGAILCLIAPTFCIQSVYVVIITLFILGLLLGNYIYNKNEYIKINLFGIIAAMMLAFSLIVRWYISNDMSVFYQEINKVCGELKFWVVVLCAIVCAVFAVFAISVLFDFIKNSANKYNENKIIALGNDIISIKEIIFIIITAFVTISLCSKSSFLYAFNDWDDANCFFTVGRSIVDNKVIYRDIYEQKGPVLYFLHALATLISSKSFIGVYFVEIICCAAFLFVTRKLIKLFINGKVCYYIPVLAMCIYSSVCFQHGDSAEELCLPLLAYGLYVSIKSVKRRTEISNKECLLLGIFSALVMWIKFTMLGFYIGMFIIPAFVLIKNKNIKTLIRQLLLIFAGVVIVSVPVLLYFGLNHSIYEMVEGYFYNNIFLYSRFSDAENQVFGQPVLNLFSAFNQLFSNLTFGVVLIIIGLIWWAYSERKLLFCHMSITIAFTFVFTYISGRSYRYYALVFGIFAFCGIVAIENIKNMYLGKIHICRHLKNPCASLVFSMALCVLFSSNTSFMAYKKSDLPQFQFAEIINEKENATLLNYGCLDGGFYTASGIIPQNKYFCKLNIKLEEMYLEQKLYCLLGLTDFVVSDHKLGFDNYELIKKSSYEQGFYIKTYYLYQHRD